MGAKRNFVKKIKCTSATQRQIVKELLECGGVTFIGWDGSRRHRAAKTLQKNNPDRIRVDYSEVTKAKLASGQACAISYDVTDMATGEV